MKVLSTTMSNYPPELANLPAIAPPKGVKPNFSDPHDTQKVPLVVLNAVFLALMLVMVLIRLQVRARIQKALGWDDCEIPVRRTTNKIRELTREQTFVLYQL